jgi:hypothetical protein
MQRSLLGFCKSHKSLPACKFTYKLGYQNREINKKGHYHYGEKCLICVLFIKRNVFKTGIHKISENPETISKF